MLIVVSYDIRDDRRRTRAAHLLKDFGRRVQYSVFECRLGAEQVERLESRLLAEIEPEEDSVRVYRLCADCRGKVAILGVGEMTEEPEVYIL